MDKPQAHAAGVLCRFQSTYLGLGWNSELCLLWRGLWAWGGPVGLDCVRLGLVPAVHVLLSRMTCVRICFT